LNLTYTVFDFGHRDARIDAAKASLLAANVRFDNTHRDLAFHVAEAYYRLLDALSQEDAARSALKDAQILQDAVETRLANGLATSPDALDARASAAEESYFHRRTRRVCARRFGHCPGYSSYGDAPDSGSLGGSSASETGGTGPIHNGSRLEAEARSVGPGQPPHCPPRPEFGKRDPHSARSWHFQAVGATAMPSASKEEDPRSIPPSIPTRLSSP
jgi:Outer membrane efflux protein